MLTGTNVNNSVCTTFAGAIKSKTETAIAAKRLYFTCYLYTVQLTQLFLNICSTQLIF